MIPKYHLTKRNFSFFHQVWGGGSDFTSGMGTPNECFKKKKKNLPHDIRRVSQSKHLKTKFYANGLRPLMPLEQAMPKRNKCPSIEHYPTCEDLLKNLLCNLVARFKAIFSPLRIATSFFLFFNFRRAHFVPWKYLLGFRRYLPFFHRDLLVCVCVCPFKAKSSLSNSKKSLRFNFLNFNQFKSL